MMRWLRGGFGIILVVALGLGLYWATESKHLNAVPLGTAGTVVAAVASAVAAFAAWQSASASDRTALRAEEAMARAIRPDVYVHRHVDPAGADQANLSVSLHSMSLSDAVNVQCYVQLRDGSAQSFAIPRLAGQRPGVLLGEGHRLTLGTFPVGVDVASATLTFRDQEDIFVWRSRTEWSLSGQRSEQYERVRD